MDNFMLLYYFYVLLTENSINRLIIINFQKQKLKITNSKNTKD